MLNAWTLPFGGLLLLGGHIGDIIGRRRALIGGGAVFTVASPAGGLSASAGMLLVARAGQGIGAAAAAPTVLALITSASPTRPREAGIPQRIRGYDPLKAGPAFVPLTVLILISANASARLLPRLGATTLTASGAVSGLLNVMQQIGAALGPAILVTASNDHAKARAGYRPVPDTPL